MAAGNSDDGLLRPADHGRIENMSEAAPRFATFSEVLSFAIQREREAQEIYQSYSKATPYQGMRTLLVSMAEQEREHEKKLHELAARGDGDSLFRGQRAQDLGLEAYTTAVVFSPRMNYQDFLLLVIRKENESLRLYAQLRDRTVAADVRDLFDGLAEEEKRHKAWAQDRYDLEILKEN
jgi:rubrerythrin